MARKRSYRKGYVFEREVKLKLEKDGWRVIRSAGSKIPDLIAAKDGKIIIVECKVSEHKTIYLRDSEVKEIKEIAKSFNGDAVYAIKYKGKTIFADVSELIKKGKMYQLDLE